MTELYQGQKEHGEGMGQLCPATENQAVECVS